VRYTRQEKQETFAMPFMSGQMRQICNCSLQEFVAEETGVWSVRGGNHNFVRMKVKNLVYLRQGTEFLLVTSHIVNLSLGP
jgi:hypothetical protein